MLKQRIATAVVLVPPLVAALFLLPPVGVVILLGAFIVAAAWEWATLSGLRPVHRVGYLAAVLVAGSAGIAGGLRFAAVTHAVLAIGVLWWAWVPFELSRRSGIFHWPRGRLLAGLLTLIPAWVALGLLHVTDSRPPLLLLFVLLLVAVADTAAFAAGHAFGRTRLAPSISPGKTVEGVIGGTVAVMLLAYFYGTMTWYFEGSALTTWVALAAGAGLVSVLGDLGESKLKRIAGAKDSGALLPGHGGVLDRIDALTAAAPTFVWGWLMLFDARS